MDFQVVYKASTKHAIVQVAEADVPATYENIGEFSDDNANTLGTDPNVAFHYVRDLLYFENETDMANVNIEFAPQSLSILPATAEIDLSDEETIQLVPTVVPAANYAGTITYVSSDPTKATVDADGLVTPVAAGETTITATASASPDLTDTCVVTVVA